MRKIKRRWKLLGLATLSAISIGIGLWMSLTHVPEFYRATSDISPERRQAEAERFVAQSLQLRNDIVNEPRWEAAFSAEEVNSWLAEDLVRYFADQMPRGISEPRVAFEMDRVILAFQLDEGPLRSVVWVVARVRVPEGNVIALTIEKVRAGVIPVPFEQLRDKLTAHAAAHGLDLRWEREGDLPVATIAYTPSSRRRDVILERLDVLDGQIRLAGRSDRAKGSVSPPTLPGRKTLQTTFPKKNRQQAPSVSGSLDSSVRRSSIVPET